MALNYNAVTPVQPGSLQMMEKYTPSQACQNGCEKASAVLLTIHN
jgi:hypothetical protein